MSYDLFVWSVKPFKTQYLPDKSLWKILKNESEFQTKAWQVCVSKSVEVKKLKSYEKVPKKVKKIMPKVAYRTSVWLEPLGAGYEGYKKIGQVARYIIQQTDGVIEDLSSGEIETVDTDHPVISSIKQFFMLKNKIRFA